MEVRRYKAEDAEQWDSFCATSCNATLLHTRGYLGYHRNRFDDWSLIFLDDKGEWLGVMPAAQDPSDNSSVVSHPGITYGGVVRNRRLYGARMLEALNRAAAFYAGSGYKQWVYKVLPYIYHRVPSQDDLYALFRLGAERFRCDLSTSIDLQNWADKSSRRQRALRTAQKAGVVVRDDGALIDEFWTVLRDNLARKHDAEPVHSKGEIRELVKRFTGQIRFAVGQIDDEIIAGVMLFVAGPVHHAQYIASCKKGLSVNALDAVFEHCIQRAWAEGAQWFDFGISNEQQGKQLNSGLCQFKTEFGGGGVVHEFYKLKLGEI